MISRSLWRHRQYMGFPATPQRYKLPYVPTTTTMHAYITMHYRRAKRHKTQRLRRVMEGLPHYRDDRSRLA